MGIRALALYLNKSLLSQTSTLRVTISLLSIVVSLEEITLYLTVDFTNR